jgi:hypothetical protein
VSVEIARRISGEAALTLSAVIADAEIAHRMSADASMIGTRFSRLEGRG